MTKMVGGTLILKPLTINPVGISLTVISTTSIQMGYAVTDWQVIDGKNYYFEPIEGHDLECAFYKTDSNGVQEPAEF